MVQFLQRAEDPSVRIGQQLAGIIESGIQGYQQGKQQKQMEAERQNFKQQFGIDLSRDPQLAKVQMAEALKGDRKKKEMEEIMKLMNPKGVSQPDNGLYSPPSDMEGEEDLPPKKFKERSLPFTETQIKTMSFIDPQKARIMQTQNENVLNQNYREKKFQQQEKHFESTREDKQKELDRKIYEADREYHSKVSRPIIEEAVNTIKSYPIVSNDLQIIENAIESDDTSGLIPFMVDKMGLESFRNPQSALFNNAIKNLYIASLQDLPGGRLNQYIERYLAAAQPAIGRDKLANLSPLYLQKFREDLKNERARLELEIAKEDNEKYGYVRDDVSQRANERMGDYANKRQEKLAVDLRERQEKEMLDGDILNEIIGKNVFPDTPLTPRTMGLLWIKNGGSSKNKDDPEVKKKNDEAFQKAFKEAKDLGFKIPQNYSRKK